MATECKEVKKALKLPSTPIGQFEMNEVGGLDSLRYDTLGATVIKKIHHNSIPRRPLSKSKVQTCFENMISTMIRTTYLQ